MFLHIVGHHASYSSVSNRFRLSIATINRIFNQVLAALAHNLYDEFVTQPGPEYVSEQNARGLVVPYDGERYHLRDFEGVGRYRVSFDEGTQGTLQKCRGTSIRYSCKSEYMVEYSIDSGDGYSEAIGDIAVRHMMSNNMEEDHELLPNCIVFVVRTYSPSGKITPNAISYSFWITALVYFTFFQTCHKNVKNASLSRVYDIRNSQ
ncbi:hypothetical protein E4U39_005674 [Claviceps sp. Clav50 group G5]|nr:hypothetical protein E4U39_005674 [Claviceps sp. Clav50 group G5]